MTKRMLSLLLALVMTLSLCVPALAADEFAAEAVTEVEEQAPEAPEAPVAPEAEEPAEEPVVDEPAAEEAPEAVEDEPEMASIVPDELVDDPMAIAVGSVKEKWTLRLTKAIEKADPYKARVDAGELFVIKASDSTSAWSKFDYKADSSDDPAKLFNDAYKEVQRNLDGIDGIENGGDVTEKSAETAVVTLMKLLPASGDNWGSNLAYYDGSNGDYYLTDEVTAKMADALDPSKTSVSDGLGYFLQPGDEDHMSYRQSSALFTIEPDAKPSFGTSSTTVKAIVKELGTDEWTMAYRSDYLDALEAAANAADAFNKNINHTYKDFTAVSKLILDAYDKEEAAAIPNQTDAAELQKALDKLDSIFSDKNFDLNDWYDNTTNAVLAQAKVTTLKGYITTYGQKLTELTTTTGFVAKTSYYEFAKMLNDVKVGGANIDENEVTLEVKSAELQADTSGNLRDKISVTVTIADKGDGHTYGYTYTVNDVIADTSDNSLSTNGNITTAVAQDDVKEITIGRTGASGGKFTGNAFDLTPIKPDSKPATTKPTTFNVLKDKVVITFYTKRSDGTWQLTKPVATYPVKLPSDEYVGPGFNKDADGEWKIAKEYTGTISTPLKYDSTKVKNDKPLGDFTYAVQGDAVKLKINLDKTFTKPYDTATVQVSLYDKDGKSVLTQAVSTGTDYTSSNTIDVNLVNVESKLTPTGMQLKLEVSTASGITPLAHPDRNGVASITFETLDKWSGIAELNKFVKAAQKLEKGDYELKTSGIPSDITTLDIAWGKLNDNITNCQNIIKNAPNVVNSLTNRDAAAHAANDLVAVAAYMQLKSVDSEALLDAIEAAKDLNEDDYSVASWVALEDALAEANAAKTSSKQSVVDAATEALEAAIKALTAPTPVSKTALNASIAAAEALKEADYTPESWAANKAAIDAAVAAAKTVAANANATQSMVDAAKAALDAAVAKLVSVKPVEPEGPKAPTSNNGTGWVLYENTWYFFKKGEMVKNYWVGKIDGASQWDSNWYYVGADGKMATGMQYIDDLHGGYGWYFLQPTNTKGEIGKMLTGYQWVGGQYGECYFSKANGSSGKCTWSELLGNWNGTTWVK